MLELVERAEHKMDKAIMHLEEQYGAVRAGRANPAVLDKIMVDYYDAPTPIQQLAAVSVTEARVLTIQPWDPTVIKLIEKAIQTSDLGVNPQNDGKVIRLIFPALNEERRKDLAKEISKMSEDTKVAIRNIRREQMDKLKKMKKASEITEDDYAESEIDIQKVTDKYCKKADEAFETKKKEIMEI